MAGDRRRRHHPNRIPRTVLGAQHAPDADVVVDVYPERGRVLAELLYAVRNRAHRDADLAAGARREIDQGLDLGLGRALDERCATGVVLWGGHIRSLVRPRRRDRER